MSQLGLGFNRERYVGLLSKLVGETEFLQNNLPKFVPQEDRAIKHLLALLEPHSKENGGVLSVEHVSFVKGRGNLIIDYFPEGAKGTLAFIGSHLDVVPANPSTWKRNPFKLVIEGEKLHGRGTTDCLGHVALITELFLQLAEKKAPLKFSVTAVFIACEENSTIPAVGADMLLKTGRLEHLKKGPVYWMDSADTNPRIGTASILVWKLRAKGRHAHSSLPHRAINSLELAMEATAYIQRRFYHDFPPHPEEQRYRFATPSTMKPTQMSCAAGNVNEIPEWTEVRGDIRLTPFYSIYQCKEKLQGYAENLNGKVIIRAKVKEVQNNVAIYSHALMTTGAFSRNVGKVIKGIKVIKGLSLLPARGPSHYSISDEKLYQGEVEFSFVGEPYKGIACNMESPAFKYLHEATMEELGESTPFSMCGSLPLVGDMKEAGFDVQVCGYGHSSVYHGENEYCTLSNMENGLKILSRVLHKFNTTC